MAQIIDPKKDLSDEIIKWEPGNIPCSKPFIHIVTSPSGSLTTQDEMNFIKTKSLIYSIFHTKAQYVHFELGYPKNAKWFEFLKDKWGDYSIFFISGYIEAIYPINEKDSKIMHIQVDAKTIDFDVRFRASTISSSSPSSLSSPKSTNAFAIRRNQYLDSSPRTRNTFTTESEKELRNDELTEDVDPNDDVVPIPNARGRKRGNDDDVAPTATDTQISTPISKTKKRQLSDLCDELYQTNINEPIDDVSAINDPVASVPVKSNTRGRKRGRGRGKK